MEKLLKEDARQKFADHGLEVQFPPEYEAGKTVMLRNVDAFISSMSEGEMLNQLRKYNVRKVIKIPNNDRLLKLIFETTNMADRAIEEGIQIKFQKFDSKSMEKEMFVAIIPCYRCYKYDHQRRHCKMPEDYRICSICAKVGHTYSACKEEEEKCINFYGNHRTLAARCPERKKIIKEKLKERRKHSIPRREITQNVVTEEISRTKLPENYLAVMAAAITIAERREAEIPGVYQYIMDEMLKANNIPLVKFPESVISGYRGRQQQAKDDQKKTEKAERKRQRSSTDGEFLERDGEVEEMEEHVLLEDGTWVLRSSIRTPLVTPVSTPASTPAQTPFPTSAQAPLVTPGITPQTTPAPTPASSPRGEGGAVAKEPKKQRQQEKQKQDKDPGLLLVFRSDVILPESMTHHYIMKEVVKGKVMKYVYTNQTYSPELVKKCLKEGRYNLANIKRVPLPLEHFNNIKTGGTYKLQDTRQSK